LTTEVKADGFEHEHKGCLVNFKKPPTSKCFIISFERQNSQTSFYNMISVNIRQIFSEILNTHDIHHYCFRIIKNREYKDH